MVGKLERVILREVWVNEAKDFTAWLSENLEILSDQIDYQPLSFIEREKAIEREGALGSFSADILAETPDGEYVIIENQLEKTDHDQLGKLIKRHHLRVSYTPQNIHNHLE